MKSANRRKVVNYFESSNFANRLLGTRYAIEQTSADALAEELLLLLYYLGVFLQNRERTKSYEKSRLIVESRLLASRALFQLKTFIRVSHLQDLLI